MIGACRTQGIYHLDHSYHSDFGFCMSNPIRRLARLAVSPWRLRGAEKAEQLAERLPPEFRIQGLRSLSLRGVSDGQLASILEDYRVFSKKRYRTIHDPVRVCSLVECVLLANDLPGDIAECGVFQGSSAKLFHLFAGAEKKLHLFDTFQGFTTEDRQEEQRKGMRRDPGAGHINTSLKLAQDRIYSGTPGFATPPDPNRVHFHVGPVQETLPSVSNEAFALVHLDMDLFAPTKFAIDFFVPRLVPGGILLLHDFAVREHEFRGVFDAVSEVDTTPLIGPLPFGDQSTVLFVKC